MPILGGNQKMGCYRAEDSKNGLLSGKAQAKTKKQKNNKQKKENRKTRNYSEIGFFGKRSLPILGKPRKGAFKPAGLKRIFF